MSRKLFFSNSKIFKILVRIFGKKLRISNIFSTFAVPNDTFPNMKQTYTYPVLYQDVDMNRKLRLYTLENMLLSIAGSAADENEFGIKKLLPMGYTWILTRMNIEMDIMPTHNDQLRIETWIEQNAHMLSTRNFRIYKESGNESQLIGRAKSVWAVLDIERREIVNIFDDPMFSNKIDGEVLSMDRPAKILPITTPTHQRDYQIHYSDMDYNGHCNSCKYLQIMLDTRRPAFWLEDLKNGKETPLRLDINYQKEVYLDDAVQVRCLENANDIQYTMLTENGQLSCSAKLTKREIQEC